MANRFRHADCAILAARPRPRHFMVLYFNFFIMDRLGDTLDTPRNKHTSGPEQLNSELDPSMLTISPSCLNISQYVGEIITPSEVSNSCTMDLNLISKCLSDNHAPKSG
ncbi:hypothetical protein F511_12626 [Dorcoceras hygrometricum]|uniref:Uncharacterized protein n=1 Tax=Dorcoceras hygrometricum TaxID=472368 RepID=A0A2Z7CTA7_9LAMI|nr:hypothetical protein F511_12626 [Dorcoceras hygrometricum]